MCTAGVAAAEGGKPAKKPTRRAAAAQAKLLGEVKAAVASADPGRMCRAAIALGKAGDHARAGLLVPSCSDPSLAADTALAASARTTRIAVSRAATAGDWSKIELVIKGDGAALATVDAFPEIPLVSGAWRLPPGTYKITAGPASTELTLSDGIRSLVMLEPPLAVSVRDPKQKTVDFTSGEPMDAPVAGPPKVEHGSLLPERYRRGLAAKPKR